MGEVMNDETLIVAGMLTLLMIAMLILAGMALTLRGFQTLNATIVSLLAMAFKDRLGSPSPEGENSPQNEAIVAQQEDPPPAFDDLQADLTSQANPPPLRPPHTNGRGKV
jgi:hypothetical protein